MKAVKKLRLAIAAIAGICVTLSASAQDNILSGAGGSSVFSKIYTDYHQTHDVDVKYQPIGSGGGILQLINKNVDFVESAAPLTAAQTAKIGARVLHLPVGEMAVAIVYNLPGLTTGLNLTGKVIAEIYMSKITRWNSPEIKALNPKVNLPDLPIVVIHRTESSGTSYIFTDYLTKVSDDWAKKVGKGLSVNWPSGLGGKAADDLSGLVNSITGAIGYIDLSEVAKNKMACASIQNLSGKFITPTLATTALSSSIDLPADGVVSLTNTANPGGYPISSFTWVLVYKEQNYNGRSAASAKAVLQLFWYIIHDGQKVGETMYHAKLSPSAEQVAENILKSLTYGGKAIL